jgi:hypothetical protein
LITIDDGVLRRPEVVRACVRIKGSKAEVVGLLVMALALLDRPR